jgi:hypothetical protein
MPRAGGVGRGSSGPGVLSPGTGVLLRAVLGVRTPKEDAGRAGSAGRGSSLSPKTSGSGDGAWRVARTAASGEGASRGEPAAGGSVYAGRAATRGDACAEPPLPSTAGWASKTREGWAAATAAARALGDCGALLLPPPPCSDPPSAAFSLSRRYEWTAACASLRETSPRTAGLGGGRLSARVLASCGAVAAFTRLPTCLSAASTAASTARCTASRLRAGKTSRGPGPGEAIQDTDIQDRHRNRKQLSRAQLSSNAHTASSGAFGEGAHFAIATLATACSTRRRTRVEARLLALAGETSTTMWRIAARRATGQLLQQARSASPAVARPVHSVSGWTGRRFATAPGSAVKEVTTDAEYSAALSSAKGG